MEREYNVGTWLTPSDEYIKDIKQTLVEKGVATELTPNEELNEVVKGITPLKTWLDMVKTVSSIPLGVHRNFTEEDVEILFGNNTTENVTNFDYMFTSASAKNQNNLKIVKLPLFNTKNATSMRYMFGGLAELEEVPLFDTSNVTDMEHMFASGGSTSSTWSFKIKTVPLFNTSKVQKMGYMFYRCQELEEAPLFDMSSLTQVTHMFDGCKKLVKVPPYNFVKATDISYMFANCESLKELPKFNTNNIQTMNSTFYRCNNLETLSNFSMSNVSTAEKCFMECYKLKEFKGFNTSKLSNATYMLSSCNELETVVMNVIKCTSSSSLNYVVSYCPKLTNLTLSNIKANLTIGSGSGSGTYDYGHLLTLDSLINTCKECIKQSSSRTLTVGTANLEKLADVYVRFVDINQTEIAVGEKGEVEICEADNNGAMTITEYMTLKNWTLA